MNDFTKSFQETIKRFDDLPEGKKADYRRGKSFQKILEAQAKRNVLRPAPRLDKEGSDEA